MLQIGKIVFGHMGRPVMAVGIEELGTGGSHGGDLDVVGAAGAGMDRLSMFTGAAAVEVSGDHDDGGGNFYARVQGCEQDRLRSAAGGAGDPYPVLVCLGQREQVVEGADAAQDLDGLGQRRTVVFLFELKEG